MVVDFQSMYNGWQQCRRRKGTTPQAQRCEFSLLENLITTAQALQQESWQPAPPVCFGVSQPKVGEMHAVAFGDRVVHHWLVPRLEVLFEPVFIHDVYSNRAASACWEPVSVSGYLSRPNKLVPAAFPGCVHPHSAWQSNRCFQSRKNHRSEFWNSVGALRYQIKLITLREQGYLKGGLKRCVLDRAMINREAGIASTLCILSKRDPLYD